VKARAAPALEQTTAGFSGYVLNGRPTHLNGRLSFTFWTEATRRVSTGGWSRSYREIPAGVLLTQGYTIVSPPGFVVNVVDMEVKEARISRAYDNQYAIEATLSVSVPRDWPKGTCEILLHFPQVEASKRAFGAVEPEYSAMRFTVRTCPTVEEMAVARWWRHLLYGAGFVLLIVLGIASFAESSDGKSGRVTSNALCLGLVGIGSGGLLYHIGLLVAGLWAGSWVWSLAATSAANGLIIWVVAASMAGAPGSAQGALRRAVLLLLMAMMSAFFTWLFSFAWTGALFYSQRIVHGLLALSLSLLVGVILAAVRAEGTGESPWKRSA
jgi:hypothetical protein